MRAVTFTDALEVKHRHALADCLGLNRFSVSLEETVAQVPVRRNVYQAKTVSVSLGDSAALESDVSLKLDHPERRPAEESLLRPRSLWEEVMPFPLALFARTSQPSLPFKMTVSPAHLAPLMFQTLVACNSFEQSLSGGSLSCVVFAKEELRAWFLIQFVDGKRFRLSAGSRLQFGQEPDRQGGVFTGDLYPYATLEGQEGPPARLVWLDFESRSSLEEQLKLVLQRFTTGSVSQFRQPAAAVQRFDAPGIEL